MAMVYLINFLGMMSPGPDFFIIVRGALLYPFRYVVWTAFGIACGCVAHVSFAVFGVQLLAAIMGEVFTILRVASALYLGYLGVTALLMAAGDIVNGDGENKTHTGRAKRKQLSNWRAFSTGLFCNAFNAKALVFFISIFSQLIKKDAGLGWNASYIVGIPLMAFVWFTLLARLLTLQAFKRRLLMYQVVLTRAMGLFLLVFAGLALFPNVF